MTPIVVRYFVGAEAADAKVKTVVGTRGTNPGWDPLAFAVEECHKRGIECHAWVNPYRYANGGPGTWNTPQDQALRDSGILLTYTNSSGTTTTVLNPGLPASRERIVNVCREMIENYDIDGIIFDDYFYPSGIPTNSSAADYSLWQNSGTSLSFANWRRAQVNQMVADVYNMVQQVKPQVRFAIGPAGVAGTAATSASQHGVNPCPTGSDWQYSSLFSDPLAWQPLDQPLWSPDPVVELRCQALQPPPLCQPEHILHGQRRQHHRQLAGDSSAG